MGFGSAKKRSVWLAIQGPAAPGWQRRTLDSFWQNRVRDCTNAVFFLFWPAKLRDTLDNWFFSSSRISSGPATYCAWTLFFSEHFIRKMTAHVNQSLMQFYFDALSKFLKFKNKLVDYKISSILKILLVYVNICRWYAAFLFCHNSFLTKYGRINKKSSCEIFSSNCVH